MKAAKKDFKESLESDQSDAVITAKFDALESAKSKMHKLHFTTMLKIRKVLNPEQRKKFQELRKERRGKRHGKRGDFESESDFE